MPRKRVYIPENPIRVNSKWLPRDEQGRVKSFEFSPTEGERFLATRTGGPLTMKQLQVYVDILHWILDRIERQPELGEIVSSMRVELGRLDVLMAEREDKLNA